MIMDVIKIIFIATLGLTITGLNIDHCCSDLEKISEIESHECHTKDEQHTEDEQEQCKMDCCHQFVSSFNLKRISFYSIIKDYYFIDLTIPQTNNFHPLLYRPPIA